MTPVYKLENGSVCIFEPAFAGVDYGYLRARNLHNSYWMCTLKDGVFDMSNCTRVYDRDKDFMVKNAKKIGEVQIQLGKKIEFVEKT